MAKKMGAKVTPYTLVTLSGSDPTLNQYKNWIRANLKKSLRSGNKLYADIEPQIYYAVYDRVLDVLFNRSSVVVKLALVSDDLDTTLGFSISDASTLHYVFVKSGIAARRRGIASSLLPEKIDIITHLTKDGRSFWKEKFPEAKFNPFFQ